jgi:hypothetical protein
MSRISYEMRQHVTDRAKGLCEYCQTAQIIVVTMEVDHIIPQVAGGETDLDNLCLVCRGCNGFKLAFQTDIDPQTNQQTDLYNPRTQEWSHHFQWSEDGTFVIGLTPTGRATIQRLKMNRAGIVSSRELWVQAGWHPPKDGQFPLNEVE